MNYRLLFMVSIVFVVSGCSTETWNRAGYETMQNIKYQKCTEESPENCTERESYESYQDKVKDAE